MKDCTPHLLQLSAYTGGELSRPEHQRLENHLAQCANCRDELARDFELRQRLANAPQVACPDHVLAAIMAQTSSDLTSPRVKSQRPFWSDSSWRSWSAVAVAAVLAVLFLPGLNGVLVSDSPEPQLVGSEEFTAAEIAQAKHDIIDTLALAADVMARSGESTMSEIFGNRLPNSLSGSLTYKRAPHSTDAQSDDRTDVRNKNTANASHLGGNG